MNKQMWLDTVYLDAENGQHPALLNMGAYSRAEPASGGAYTQLYYMDGMGAERLNLPFAAFGEALTLIGANIYTPPAEEIPT